MILRLAVFTAMMLAVPALLAGEKRDGNATAELHSMQETVNPGQSVAVAFRLKPDQGWHSYWTNPGMGGMPTRVTWKLPEGWDATPLAFPVPHRFKSFGMISLGFEEETFMFSEVTVPDGAAAGPVQLAAKLSWLTCDDKNCIPGAVELVLPLEVTDSPVKMSEEAELLAEKLAEMPKKVDWTGKVIEQGDKLVVTISAPEEMDLSASDLLFTVEDLASSDKPKWEKVDNDWVAVLKKSEYFEEIPQGVTVVIFDGKLELPLIIQVS